MVSNLRTSSIHRLCSENYSGVLTESNMTDPSLKLVIEFLDVDMAFTLTRRVQEKASLTNFGGMSINLAMFEYHDPVVIGANPLSPHPILVVAEANLERGEVNIEWFKTTNDKCYCRATAYFGDASTWLSNWARTTRLVTSRIDALNATALNGTASKLTTELAYTLFGKLVNYSSMYRTMRLVILNEDEAMAEVLFPADTQGDWAVSPHFIDGVVSLSGFVLNGGTHFDNTNNFFITPSWKSMRFARPLAPGDRYLVYVRMVSETTDNDGKLGSYVGDVYILQGGEIVGVFETILFRQWPRLMLNRFFRPADAASAVAYVPTTKPNKDTAPDPFFSAHYPQQKHTETVVVNNTVRLHASAETRSHCEPISKSGESPKVTPRIDYNLLKHGDLPLTNGLMEKACSDSWEEKASSNDNASRAMSILAEELAVDAGLLSDECEITDLGLDTLMSLVISQQLREDLGIEIRDAFYLEVVTIRDLKKLVL